MQAYFKSVEPFLMVTLKYRVPAHSTHTPPGVGKWAAARSHGAQGSCKVAGYFRLSEAVRRVPGITPEGVQQPSAPR